MRTQDIWEQYHEDLRRFIQSKIKDSSITEDVLQDTFIKIHTKLSSLQASQKMKSWVFTVARNTVYDHFRNQNTVMDISDVKAEDSSPLAHDEKDCLYGIIKQLPKMYRDPIFLADIRGLKQAEVAKRLDIGLSTVKSRIQRGRKRIAQGYMECCDYKMHPNGYLVGEVKDKGDCKICR